MFFKNLHRKLFFIIEVRFKYAYVKYRSTFVTLKTIFYVDAPNDYNLLVSRCFYGF